MDDRIVDISMFCGLGNVLLHATTGAIVAVALNRSIFCRVNLTNEGLLFSESFQVHQIPKNYKRKSKNIYTLENWPKTNFTMLKTLKKPLKQAYIYPHFLLTDPYFNEFVRTHFGVHFIYFLQNRIMYFADWVLEYVKKQFKKVPKTVKVFGIHIRYHYATTSFISDGKQLVNVLFPFLDDYILNDKPYIFLTTTKSDFISLFQQKYSNRMFLSDVTKVADGKKSDAICDMCCVMMCDKMIGTYRSTFSLMAAMRSLMRAYYVTDEVDYIFRFTSSQAGLVSMVVDHLNYNYNPNFRTVVGDKYESGLRAFFYYFAI